MLRYINEYNIYIYIVHRVVDQKQYFVHYPLSDREPVGSLESGRYGQICVCHSPFVQLDLSELSLSAMFQGSVCLKGEKVNIMQGYLI